MTRTSRWRVSWGGGGRPLVLAVFFFLFSLPLSPFVFVRLCRNKNAMFFPSGQGSSKITMLLFSDMSDFVRNAYVSWWTEKQSSLLEKPKCLSGRASRPSKQVILLKRHWTWQ